MGNGSTCRDNLCLSKERAKNVRDFLVARSIQSNRLKIKGMGGTQPLDDNHPEKNRRVQLLSGIN